MKAQQQAAPQATAAPQTSSPEEEEVQAPTPQPFAGPTQSTSAGGTGGAAKVVVGIIILVVIIGAVYYFTARPSGPSDLVNVLSAQPFNSSALASVMSKHTAGYQQFHANYSGNMSLHISVFGVDIAFAGPLSVSTSRYGNDTRTDFNLLTNSSYLSSLSGSVFNLNGSMYTCSKIQTSSLLSTSSQSGTESCSALSSSSYSIANLLNLTTGSKLNLTDRSVSQSNVNGYPCTLLSSNFAATANVNSSSLGLGSLSGASVSGSMKICFSNQYYEPVGILLHITNYSANTGGVSVGLPLNLIVNVSATSIGPTSSLQYIEAIPITPTCDSLYSFSGINCTAPVVGTNGAINLTLVSVPTIFTATTYPNVKMACTTATYTLGKVIPSYEFLNVSSSLPADVSTTLPCYNQNGAKITSLAAGTPFFATILMNYSSSLDYGYTYEEEFATIETRVSNGPVVLSSHPVFLPTVPSTTIYPTYNSQDTCSSYAITANSTGTSANATCTWLGGTIYIYAAGGNSGYLSYNITGVSDGKVYTKSSTVARCLTYVGSVYMPAQTYKISMGTGFGGGSCGEEELELSSTPLSTP